MMHGRQGLTDSGRSGVGMKAEEPHPVGRVRVYEVAKEIGITNKELVSRIRALGVEVQNHMSSVEMDDVQRVRRALEKERQENLVEERLSPTVIRRRSKAPRTVGPPEPPPPCAPRAEAAPPTTHLEQELLPGAIAPQPESQDTEPAEAVGQQQNDAPVASAPVSQPSVQEEPSEDGQMQLQHPAPDGAPAATPPTPQVTPGAVVAKATAPAEDKKPVVVHRYAPGFKPGMQYGPKARAAQRANQPPPVMVTTASGDQAISAADAMKLMGGARPKVVITDLDGRKPGMRRETVTPKDLFTKGRFKGPGKKKRKPVGNRKSKQTEITTPAQHKRVIRVEDGIAVGEIAHQMGIKSTEVLKRLWAMGMTNVTLNQTIDAETASLLSNEFGYEVEDVAFSEQQVLQQEDDRPEDLESRPPVVTVMGHVDHGKTSLLDAIRNTSVVDGEAGGITQHIGASRIKTTSGWLVFLDTPGHEAFTAMRARGAQCTDIVVLVVAADDGVMPQTVEAVDHARNAQVPIIVAVNKIDRPDANPDRVKNELAERGLLPEDWGGDTMFVNVSARTREGVDQLLETLTLQADLLELTANPNKLAGGTIIESKLDKARGAMCTVLVQEGTLRVGDTIVAGEHMGKIRAMLDEHGRQVKEAGPSTPVEILGLGGVPQAGDMLNAVLDEKGAKVLAEYRHNEIRRRDLTGVAGSMTRQQILDQLKIGEAKEIKLLLKADVNGSAEAVRDALLKLTTEKVGVNVISSGVGGITETDVNLAKAAGAIIVGFNVRAAGKASQLAEQELVDVQTYDVIYEMLDDVKVMMQGMLPRERREKAMGRAEVRETFHIPKIGTIAGCSVQEGKVTRHSLLRLFRNNVKVCDGKIASLKRFKDDAKEVVQGYECGLSIDGYNDIQVGDVIEVYEFEEIVPSLN